MLSFLDNAGLAWFRTWGVLRKTCCELGLHIRIFHMIHRALGNHGINWLTSASRWRTEEPGSGGAKWLVNFRHGQLTANYPLTIASLGRASANPIT
jgi:hypothetical protein